MPLPKTKPSVFFSSGFAAENAGWSFDAKLKPPPNVLTGSAAGVGLDGGGGIPNSPFPPVSVDFDPKVPPPKLKAGAVVVVVAGAVVVALTLEVTGVDPKVNFADGVNEKPPGFGGDVATELGGVTGVVVIPSLKPVCELDVVVAPKLNSDGLISDEVVTGGSF